MLTPTTLHIRQTPAGKGKHAILLTLRRPGQPDLEDEATIKFSLTEQEQEDLRWYMEDYLQRRRSGGGGDGRADRGLHAGAGRAIDEWGHEPAANGSRSVDRRSLRC